MRPLPIRLLLLCAALSPAVTWSETARADDTPQLDWRRPVRCMDAPTGGTVRVQCDLDHGAGGAGRGPERCLVAPSTMASFGGELERVQPCATHETVDAYHALEARGARLVPAVAEAPPGYARAESGRAFQVKFDLLNRLYLGVGWAPTFQLREETLSPSSFPFGRAQAEVGLDVSVLSPGGRSRHDIHVLTGTSTFGDLELNGQLFSYDYQHMRRRPAFWLSTFIGDPAVHPVPSPIGWGFRLLRISDRPPAFRDALDMEFAEVHLSWNPWQSSDLYSHLRIEAGGDLGKHWEDRTRIAGGLGTGLWYAGPTGAVRSRFSLGEGGLHYMFVDFTFRRPTIAQGEKAGAVIHRGDASLAYEGIFMAINDQPVSLRLAALGTTRNDLSSDVRDVEVRFMAGLRFSFWAPPRVFEPLPEFEDP